MCLHPPRSRLNVESIPRAMALGFALTFCISKFPRGWGASPRKFVPGARFATRVLAVPGYRAGSPVLKLEKSPCWEHSVNMADLLGLKRSSMIGCAVLC